MSEFKGTKGKWQMMVGGFTKNVNTPNVIQIYSANYDLEMICKVWKDSLLNNRNQNFEANAKLISCAPEMLGLLEDLVNSDVIKSSELHQKSKQLIKKATEL